MYSQVVVPLDGGAFSTRALGPAQQLAAACEAPLVLVSYALTAAHTSDLRLAVKTLAAEIDHPAVVVKVEQTGDVARAIAKEVAADPGSLVCMSSVGRSHTSPMLGSVAEGVLREVTTPIVLVGPAARAEKFSLAGVMTVCLDGSTHAESILSIAASWSIVFGLRLRLMTVLGLNTRRAGDVPPVAALDSVYLERIAGQLQPDVGLPIDVEMLPGNDPVGTIADAAQRQGFTLLAAATHGQSGWHRLVAGSVAMGLVHRAPCPVLAYRPPQLPR